MISILSINGRPLPMLMLDKAVRHVKAQPKSRRKNPRGVVGSERSNRKRANRDLAARAHRAQMHIEKMFQTHAGMSWNDVQRELNERGWSFRQLHLLAQKHGLVKEPSNAIVVAPVPEKKKTGVLVPVAPKLVVPAEMGPTKPTPSLIV